MEYRKNFLSAKQIAILTTLAKSPKSETQIQQVFNEASLGEIQFESGGLSALLRKLAEQQLLRSYWGKHRNGVRQKYYEITPKGYVLLQKTNNFFSAIAI